MVNFKRDEQERRIGEYINKLEENVKDNLVNNQNLIKHVGNMDENKKADIKTAVSQAVENAANNVIMSVPAYTESKNFYFTAEIILGVTIFVVILGNFYLLSSGKTTSDGIIAIGSAAVGALAGLFSASK
ncbi:MAG: hypothetical protein NHB15_02890 [Methanosarcina barkeri]|nr:hypothetical protein [Methanosarcina sp. ERenArc_MAG2]